MHEIARRRFQFVYQANAIPRENCYFHFSEGRRLKIYIDEEKERGCDINEKNVNDIGWRRGRGDEKMKFVHGNFICNPKIGIISPRRCFRAPKSIKPSTQTHTQSGCR